MQSDAESTEQQQFFGEIIHWFKCLFADCSHENAEKDHEDAEKYRSLMKLGFKIEVSDPKKNEQGREKKHKEHQDKKEKGKYQNHNGNAPDANAITSPETATSFKTLKVALTNKE